MSMITLYHIPNNSTVWLIAPKKTNSSSTQLATSNEHDSRGNSGEEDKKAHQKQFGIGRQHSIENQV